MARPKIEFSTIVFFEEGRKVVAASFRVETPGAWGKTYSVTILPDRSVRLRVGTKLVDSLPVVPEAKALLEAVRPVARDAVKLLHAPYQSPEYRTLWWRIYRSVGSPHASSPAPAASAS